VRSHPFPWPWRGPENRRVVLAGLLWIALLGAWGFAMHDLVPGAGPSPWPADIAAEAPPYARFDSGWYREIARDGYGPPPPAGRESEHAFFPLYPYLARAVHLTTGLGVFRSLLLVAWASFFLALPLFLEEARRRGVPEDPWRALPFLLLYPSAFFLQAAYSDAVFFLVALLAFRSLRTGSVASAVALGFVAGFCRAPAAALGPALAVAWWLEENGPAVRWKVRTLAPAALLCVAPLAGALSYMFGIGLLKGEPGLFFRVMAAWPERVTGGASGPAAFVGRLAERVSSGEVLRHPGLLVPYALVVLLLGLSVLQFRAGRPSDAAWMTALVALPVLTGTDAGIPRYTMTVFPVTLSLAALLGGRPRLRLAWLAGSTLLLLYYSAKFVRWGFVS
jgi:hypothetical protein